MDKNQLYKLIHQAEQRTERERPKRAVKAILIFSTVYFFLFCIISRPHGPEFFEYILLAVICGVANLFVSTPVFHWLFTASQAEDNYIKELKNKLNQ